jgi:Mrp family chromosome partitioning ATPase
MSQLYEAMERAERQSVPRAGVSSAQVATTSKVSKGLEETFLSLYGRLESLIEGKPARTVQFAGVRTGEDSSKLAIRFAEVVSARLGKRILVLAIDKNRHYLKGIVGKNAPVGADSTDDGALDGLVLSPLGSITVGLLADGAGSSGAPAAQLRLPGVIKALQTQYDFIVVDTPRLDASADAELVSAHVDGVVLVVFAGRTRWQVTQSATEQVEAQHGRVLGLILNRRRYYIPDFIYKRI